MIKYLLLFFSLNLYANPEIATQMVPKGRIYETEGRDIILRTMIGTKVRIEFKRNGGFQEAKGMNLNKGDEFEPGDGLISLGTAAKRLTKSGFKPEGHWRLSEDNQFGWVYEIDQHLINAKTGDILVLK